MFSTGKGLDLAACMISVGWDGVISVGGVALMVSVFSMATLVLSTGTELGWTACVISVGWFARFLESVGSAGAISEP